MKIICILFRIVLTPVAFLLTALLALLALLLALSTRLLAILSSIGVTLALLLFLSGNPQTAVSFFFWPFSSAPMDCPRLRNGYGNAPPLCGDCCGNSYLDDWFWTPSKALFANLARGFLWRRG